MGICILRRMRPTAPKTVTSSQSCACFASDERTEISPFSIYYAPILQEIFSLYCTISCMLFCIKVHKVSNCLFIEGPNADASMFT